MANVLTHLQIESIGLVDKGASGDAANRPAVLLFKRAGNKEHNQELSMTLSERIKSLFTKHAPGLPVEAQEQLAKGFAAIAKAACPKCDAQVPDGAKFCPECGASMSGDGAAGDAKPNPFGKSDTEVIAKKLEDETAKRVELEKRLAAVEVEKVEQTFIAKAEKDMKYMPGMSTTELGKVLKRASETLGKDEFAKLEASLKSASEAISKGALLKEQGSALGGDATAYAKLQAIAKQLREKDQTMTDAAAMVAATNSNPDLAKQYAEERK